MPLFFGYLNYKNFGDDLLLEIASKPYMNWDILSSKDSLLDHFSKISKAQEIIILGGLFQDTTSIRSNIYYFLVIFIAKFLGKEIESKATGIGPFKSKLSENLCKSSYKMMDKVSVRDQFSSDFLTKYEIRHELVNDLAFNFKYDENKVRVHKYLPVDKDIVSINPFLSEIETKDKLEIICEPKQKPRASKYIYSHEYNPHEIFYILKNAKSITTQRFHIAVLAKLAGKEFSTTQDAHKLLHLRP